MTNFLQTVWRMVTSNARCGKGLSRVVLQCAWSPYGFDRAILQDIVTCALSESGKARDDRIMYRDLTDIEIVAPAAKQDE